MITELEKEIQEQFGAELMIHDNFNSFSSLFKIKFPSHFHVLFEVEKVPEIDCYLLAQSGRSVEVGGVCTIGTVRYTLNTKKEVLNKLGERSSNVIRAS